MCGERHEGGALRACGGPFPRRPPQEQLQDDEGMMMTAMMAMMAMMMPMLMMMTMTTMMLCGQVWAGERPNQNNYGWSFLVGWALYSSL